MSRSKPGINMGEASFALEETLAELAGARDISDMSPLSVMARDEAAIIANIHSMFGKSPMSSSKFLEFIPVPDELAMYSHQIKYSKAIQTTPLRRLRIEDILNDIAVWRFKINSNWVPPLSEGYDGFRFKSDWAIRRRYDKALELGLSYIEAFNDIMSFRIRVQDYPEILPKYFKVIDMVHSRPLEDNGYRAMHMYFQMSTVHYPIEVQLWGGADWEFNTWGHLHDIFKYPELGRKLRLLYDMGKIDSLAQFNKYRVELVKGDD